MCLDPGATARRYATHLHDTLMTMVADQDESVRAALAGQFGEVCRLLGKERCQHYMKRCAHPVLVKLGNCIPAAFMQADGNWMSMHLLVQQHAAGQSEPDAPASVKSQNQRLGLQLGSE